MKLHYQSANEQKGSSERRRETRASKIISAGGRLYISHTYRERERERKAPESKGESEDSDNDVLLFLHREEPVIFHSEKLAGHPPG